MTSSSCCRCRRPPPPEPSRGRERPMLPTTASYLPPLTSLPELAVAHAGAAVHRVLVELRDHLLAEQPDGLHRDLLRQPDRHAEADLVAADRLVAPHLLHHLIGVAAQEEAVLDALLDVLQRGL